MVGWYENSSEKTTIQNLKKNKTKPHKCVCVYVYLYAQTNSEVFEIGILSV